MGARVSKPIRQHMPFSEKFNMSSSTPSGTVNETAVPLNIENFLRDKKPIVTVEALPVAKNEPQMPTKPVDIEGYKKTLPFDPAEIKKKYLEERDKRLRADGNAQYREVKYDFKHYLEDPYTPLEPREPLDIDIDFLVLGGGYGGLLIAARLVEAGVTNIKILDKAGDFGGTWYWNRYPGAACDIEAYCYMPLCEETNYVPSEKYTKAPELQEHAQRIGKHYGLYEKAIFHAEANDLKWDEATNKWHVGTDRGDMIRARFVATASGPLNMPKLPGVSGIDRYKGHSFHTSRWDYDYTGGNIRGNLDKIGDKRIGIIGTGATSVQAIPHLGIGAEKGEKGHLYVFQRTPSSVDFRNNQKTDPTWAASLKPGWQAERRMNFMRAMGGALNEGEEDEVNDGWTATAKWMKNMGIDRRDPKSMLENAQIFEVADMQIMEGIRNRCDKVVKDPTTAAGLKAWYRRFCKRPCFHDEYLDAFNSSSVTLVDTDGKGIDRITEKGIVANGKTYELDCIIYATGFEVGTDYSRRSNFNIVGRNGQTLPQKWAEGWSTLHGFFTRGFPNLFIVSTVQSGFAANFVHMLDEQAKHIAWVAKACVDRGIVAVDASEKAEKAWVDGIVDGSWLTAGFQSECTPGYYNLEGQLNASLRMKRGGSYAAGPVAFTKVLEDWREAGDFAGLESIKEGEMWEDVQKEDGTMLEGESMKTEEENKTEDEFEVVTPVGRDDSSSSSPDAVADTAPIPVVTATTAVMVENLPKSVVPAEVAMAVAEDGVAPGAAVAVQA